MSTLVKTEFLNTADSRQSFTGFATSRAGDLNGDGIEDLIISAYAESFRPPTHVSMGVAGAIYVVFGQLGGLGPNFDLATLNGTNGFKVSSFGHVDFMGYSTANLGDVNGDGRDDIAWSSSRKTEYRATRPRTPISTGPTAS